MTEPTYPGSDPSKRDPLARLLIGCAIVVGVLVAVAAVVLLVVGWNVTRDPAPGRPVESFLLGDETRYWRLDVRADDAGLRALAARIDEINESARANMFKGTFLEGLPLPRRHARLEDVAPFALEVALTGSAGEPAGWSARGTFSHGVLRLRAATRFMRWAASHGRGPSATSDVDGIPVTEIRGDSARDGREVRFAFATVGNRLLAGGDTARVRRMLGAKGPRAPESPDLEAMHAHLKLPGEDAWAFASDLRIGGPDAYPVRAIASFDVAEDDALAFRIAVYDAEARLHERGFSGAPDSCRAVARAFLPWIKEEAFEIDGDGAAASGAGSTVFTGRIVGLSTRIGGLINGMSALRLQKPSASPPPASPPPPSGPRTDTPAAPPRGESPTRPH